MGHTKQKRTSYSRNNGHSVKELGQVNVRDYKCPACDTSNSLLESFVKNETEVLKTPVKNHFFVHVDLKGDSTPRKENKVMEIMVKAGFDITMPASDHAFCLPSGFFYYGGFEHAGCVQNKVQKLLREFEDCSVFTIEQTRTAFSGFDPV